MIFILYVFKVCVNFIFIWCVSKRLSKEKLVLIVEY